MQEEDFEKELKVLVVGNGSVGKTSMIRRFCKGMFTDEYKKTIGVDFLEKTLYVDSLGQEVRFMVWDTAGQDEFDSIVRAYFRGAGAAVLAFSTTDKESFDAVAKWKSRVESECGNIAMAIVQNKVDLVDQAAMSGDEVEATARRLGLRLYRTCVKEDINVTEVFVYLSELHQKKLAAGQLGQAVGAAAAAGSTTGNSSITNGGHSSGSHAQGSSGAPSTPSTASATGRNNAFGAAGDDAGVQHRAATGGEARTVDLAPSKQRTKGKKSIKDKFTSCTVM